MLEALIIITLAIGVLAWSANGVACSAQDIACMLGVSPMLIGFTVVAFGTSAPELATSLLAALAGKPAVAIGNGIGSNLVNTGVVLGLTLVSIPMLIPRQVLYRELPLLLASTLLLGYFFSDNWFRPYEGWWLLGLFVPVMWLLVHWNNTPGEQVLDTDKSLWRTWAVFFFMLAVLLYSADQLVKSAIFLAYQWGVSELFIGTILVAIGTSLPELVVCIAAVLNRSSSMALGNILGSNIFNIFGVLGLAAGLSIGYGFIGIFARAYIPLAFITLFFATIVYFAAWRSKKNKDMYLGRLSGVALLCAYAVCVVIFTG